jgi:hypothetical protein
MAKLPDKIIIRYHDKHGNEVIYRKAKNCSYFNQTKQKFLIFSDTEQKTWTAIKLLCEYWFEKEKIFFEFDYGKKNIKHFLDAEAMLQEISKPKISQSL